MVEHGKGAEKDRHIENYAIALGAAIFSGFWLGTALSIIFCVIFGRFLCNFQIVKSVFEIMRIFWHGKTILMFDSMVCLVTYCFLICWLNADEG